MVIATIIKYGLHLPDFNFDAFRPEYFQITLGGYVRILAVMTGVEVFANLVAAYDGTAAQKSNKAFLSLMIIVGTTAITMLVVGPVIYSVADPTDLHVSVFTQTMDHLLPNPLPYFGTLVGIAVLMSASAASAQGLQNLALGLKERRYIPPRMGEPTNMRWPIKAMEDYQRSAVSWSLWMAQLTQNAPCHIHACLQKLLTVKSFYYVFRPSQKQLITAPRRILC